VRISSVSRATNSKNSSENSASRKRAADKRPEMLLCTGSYFGYGWIMRGRIFRYLVLSALVFFVASFSECSSSSQSETTPSYQCYYDYVNTKVALPQFDARLFWSPDSSDFRLDAYVSVKESRLRYDRDSNLFVASYTCSIRLTGKEESATSKEIDRKVVLQNYPKPDQNSYDAFLVSFPIKSGNHEVQIGIVDNESKARSSRTYSVEVPEMSNKPLVLSDIMLLARMDPAGTRSDSAGQGRKITPFILSNVGLLPDTLKFFTILSQKNGADDSLSIYVYRLRSREINLPTFNVQMFAYQSTPYNPCGEDMDTMLVYQHAASSAFKAGTSYIFGSVPKPASGNYLLKVVVSDNGGDSATSTMKFQVHDKNFPQIADDFPTMINSLNYIAASSDIKNIVAGRTDSSIKANLVTFWKEHGGLNKMVQYYQRVSQANQLFTSCIEGWRTPMGIYFIVCGAPDDVECEGAWDEKWSYYQSSTQASMTIVFRLAQETANIEDRFYRIDQVYSNADLWDYYINQWRTSY